MRVLCLHGSGASAKIMESQLASLRSLLPPSYEFDFLDATLECDAAPEIRGIYPGPYYRFFEQYSITRMHGAAEYVREVVEEDGPYDCIMGFSQGAAVAAAYMALTQRDPSIVDPPFKMAVFICAALIPPKIATGTELVKTIGSLGSIDLPTVHIIGKRDPCYAQSVQLVQSCDPSIAQTVYHDGGHDFPRDATNNKNMAAAIERGMRTAFSGR